MTFRPRRAAAATAALIFLSAAGGRAQTLWAPAEVCDHTVPLSGVTAIGSADAFGDGNRDVLIRAATGVHYMYAPGRYAFTEQLMTLELAALLPNDASGAPARTLGIDAQGLERWLATTTSIGLDDAIPSSLTDPRRIVTWALPGGTSGMVAVLDEDYNPTKGVFERYVRTWATSLLEGEPIGGVQSILVSPSATRIELCDFDGSAAPTLAVLDQGGAVCLFELPSGAPCGTFYGGSGGAICRYGEGGHENLCWVAETDDGPWEVRAVHHVSGSTHGIATLATVSQLGPIRGVASGDGNCDGFADLCIAGDDRVVHVPCDPRTGLYYEGETLGTGLNGTVADSSPPVFDDLDGDGDADILVVYGTPGVTVLHRSSHVSHDARRVGGSVSLAMTYAADQLDVTGLTPPAVAHDFLRVIVWREDLTSGAFPPEFEPAALTTADVASGDSLSIPLAGGSIADEQLIYVEVRAIDASTGPSEIHYPSRFFVVSVHEDVPLGTAEWDAVTDPRPKGTPPGGIRILKVRPAPKQHRPNPNSGS